MKTLFSLSCSSSRPYSTRKPEICVEVFADSTKEAECKALALLKAPEWDSHWVITVKKITQNYSYDTKN